MQFCSCCTRVTRPTGARSTLLFTWLTMKRCTYGEGFGGEGIEEGRWGEVCVCLVCWEGRQEQAGQAGPLRGNVVLWAQQGDARRTWEMQRMPRAASGNTSTPGPLMLSSRLPLVTSACRGWSGPRPGKPTSRQGGPSAPPPMPLRRRGGAGREGKGEGQITMHAAVMAGSTKHCMQSPGQGSTGWPAPKPTWLPCSHPQIGSAGYRCPSCRRKGGQAGQCQRQRQPDVNTGGPSTGTSRAGSQSTQGWAAEAATCMSTGSPRAGPAAGERARAGPGAAHLLEHIVHVGVLVAQHKPGAGVGRGHAWPRQLAFGRLPVCSVRRAGAGVSGTAMKPAATAASPAAPTTAWGAASAARTRVPPLLLHQSVLCIGGGHAGAGGQVQHRHRQPHGCWVVWVVGWVIDLPSHAGGCGRRGLAFIGGRDCGHASRAPCRACPCISSPEMMGA